MPALPLTSIRAILLPYFPEPSDTLLLQLSTYLDLLLRWNARTNLSAIRDPEEIVRRHFGESLFVARHVPAHAGTLLDLGSGAGFPGVPIQLVLPDLKVTLAESQNKKAAFLREAIRTLGLSASVWPRRAEELPGGSLFDVVTLRAVDDPERALEQAELRLAPGGALLHLAGVSSESPGRLASLELQLPAGGTILRVSRQNGEGLVPRGT